MQDYLVQATYWHNPLKEDTYRKASSFLADINNELNINQTYIDNLKRLNKYVDSQLLLISYRAFFLATNILTNCFCPFCRFVLVKFANDTIVQPVDTEWFAFYAPNQDQVIQPMSESNAAVSVSIRHF